MSLFLVTVYCQRNCIYVREGKCNNTGINIDSDGYCIEYEQEIIPDADNPDHERV
jgi:hypothetical protein